MVSLHHLRRRSSLVQGVLAMFAIAWLQLAVLSCAMAGMGTTPSMAAVAIDASTLESAADGPHHQMTAEPPHDCMYCPPDADLCGDDGIEASPAAGCLYPHALKPNSPSSQPQASTIDLYVAPTDSWASRSLLQFEEPALSCYVLPPRSRPLNLLQGVQLK